MSSPNPTRDDRPKLLVLELWGLGDLIFSTALLRRAVEQFEVTLVGKPHAQTLLEPSFPTVRFLNFDAPWTAFRGKYKLRSWDWSAFFSLVTSLRQQRFDAAVSVRPDPRDHLLMRLSGARKRYGFPRRGSSVLLTHPLTPPREKRHKVEDWRELGAALGLPAGPGADPQIERTRYASARGAAHFAGIQKPTICLHTGARIPVRRWPEQHFAHVIKQLREAFDFHLTLIPDRDGYGSGLAPLADGVLSSLTLHELVDVLGRVDLLLCNDSGPAHIAASCGRPVIAVFGPTDPQWYRPWGERHLVVIRDICPWRPCFDYCRFNEPHCLTKLSPELVSPDICAHIETLIAGGVLPERLRKAGQQHVPAA